jgi:hypothetical protein
MHYDSAVYWFRDYWSNRLKLNRNIQVEDFRIDAQKDFLSKELTVDLGLPGKCSVNWPGGKFVDLVDPFKVVRQYEPQRISFALSKSGLRDELPDPNFKIRDEQINNVVAEPIAQSKGEIKHWLQLFVRVILPLFIFMLIEWVALGYLTALFPGLLHFAFLIVALSFGAFLYFVVRVFVKIGVSETTRRAVGAKATIYFYHGGEAEKFHYRSSKDKPGWLESKPYWVLRYLFTWPAELTVVKGLPFIRGLKDIERLDVWLDAKTGTTEWIVSDYHWRELWYRTEANLTDMRVWLASNFHTPRPLNISIAGKGTIPDLYRKGHPLSKKWMENVEKYKLFHSKFVSIKFEKKSLGIIDRAVVSELNSLWWEKLRYKYGANNLVYQNPDFSVTGDQPSSVTLVPTIAPISMPTVPAVFPVTPIEAPTASSIGPSTASLLPVSYRNASASRPAATSITAASSPISSQLNAKKHAGSFRYAVVVGAVAAVAVVGFIITRKGKTSKHVED